MFHSAQKKSGMAAHGLGFYPVHDLADRQALLDSRSLPNFALLVRNRNQSPIPFGDSPEFRALFANPRKEKIARCPQCRLDSRASFQLSRAVRTSMRSTVKATTAQGTDEHWTIA